MAGDESRLDRELIELLNELRVALPGVQVLFAFLLTVPFSQRFEKLTMGYRWVLFSALASAALSSLLLIAPSAHHRLRFREHDKKYVLRTANRLAIAGTVFLALAMTLVVYLTTALVIGPGAAPAAAAITGGLFVWIWYGIPLTRSLRKGG
ncbi:MAG: DUF6328 family protein [Actinomycetota bacterium]